MINYDTSVMGPRITNDEQDTNESSSDMETDIVHNEYDLSINEINDVHRLSCAIFRKKPVEHFGILFK